MDYEARGWINKILGKMAEMDSKICQLWTLIKDSRCEQCGKLGCGADKEIVELKETSEKL